MKTNGSMNRCYRLVWSQAQQAWMAVAETTRGRGKASSSVGSGVASTVLGAAGLGLMLLGAPAHAAPQGGQVTAGSASVSQSGATTTVAQSSQNVSLSWQRFNVGAAETVNFVQPSAAAIAVNRIYDTQGSQILGRINANGQVWLINPNGVLFGRGAQINVGGLVASTLDVADGDLANSTRRFAGSSSAGVVNLGHITAAPGGYVSLLGHQVINHGAISARLGTVALGAGNAISLNFSGSRLLGLQVEQSALNALADNGGLIQAAGGQVLMSAGARDSVLASVVNNTGVIEATTVQEHEGTIVLLGGMAAGTTNVGGTLDASAPNGGDGGFIETSAHNVQVADGAQITTASAQGQQGQWLIDPYDFYIAASGGNITGATLSAALGSSSVKIETTDVGTSYALTPTTGGTSGNGDIFVNDSVSWSANTLTLSAWNNININAPLNGSGAAKLALEYGQGAVSAGNTSSYNIHAPVSLPAGDNFSTKQGSDGAQLDWKVITALGLEGSTTGADLQGINGGLTGRYVLGADIDATATSGWNAGAGFAPIGTGASRFTGSFDGLGHSIGQLTIYRPTTDNVGLFGYTGAGSVLRNLGLTNVAITGSDVVGGLVGANLGVGGSVGPGGGVGSVVGGTIAITNVYATGSVTGTGAYVGGLVGHSDYSTITNSYATGSVTGTGVRVGGLVGFSSRSSITNSYATGSVSGGDRVGGLVGYTFFSTISNSYATGSVSGSGELVGGLVGYAQAGAISNSYATGSVSGTNDVGGLVGYTDGTISNSYATGSVTGTGDYVGGLVGISFGTITKSYATGSVSGSGELVGGLLGRNGRSITDSYWDTTTNPGRVGIGGVDAAQTGTTGLSTADLAATLPTGFLSSVWGNGDDQTTPYLLSHAVFAATSGSVLLGSDDSGTAYQVILNATQLQNINTTGLADNYVLGSHIDASATVGWNGGAGFAPIGTDSASTFTGTFDGLGHTIAHLTINRSGTNYVGLFGVADAGSVIRNVGLTDAAITGQQRVGALAGSLYGAISNSYATGSVSGTLNAGGLVGYNFNTITDSYATASVSGLVGAENIGGLAGRNSQDGSITNSYATGSISGIKNVGGLVGRNSAGDLIDGVPTDGGTIANSYATGSVSGLSSSQDVGGLVGWNGGDVSNSHATGSVTGTSSVGGLVGWNDGTVNDGYATGSVSGGESVGGLVGSNRYTITNSYATGSVDGAYSVGGLVGGNDFGTISNSYATGSVSDGEGVGGLAGYNYFGAISNSYATGRVTGTTYVGGLVGASDHGVISNSYATGGVSGAGVYVGALVGYDDGTITNSYWDITTTPGLVGIGGDLAAQTGATGLNTAEMRKGANFTSATTANGNVNPGWDFANTWVIYEDHTNPLLRSFMTPLTVTANNASAPKVYDGSTTYLGGTASYSVTPDSRLLGTLTYTQDSQNAGSRTITPGGLWSDQQGYLISYASGSLTVDKATLTYSPTAASFLSGQTIVGLSGAVLGFVSTDTLANSTTGTLGWSTPATSSSAPGTYRIDGGGLDALNYVFVQASAPDAGVLTLLPSTLPPQVVSTLTQVFDSLPDSPLLTAREQQQQALQYLQSAQQPASLSPTAFRGLGIDGPGVKLPPTLIGSAP